MVDSEKCPVCQEAFAPDRFIVVGERKMHLTCWVREYLSRSAQGERPGPSGQRQTG
jgi:hypothetical protein